MVAAEEKPPIDPDNTYLSRVISTPNQDCSLSTGCPTGQDDMKVDAAGRAFITKEEGEELEAYRCSAGVLTIGVGHTGTDVHEGMRITRERSQELLTADLHRFELDVQLAVRVPLNQNQINALVSFCFNLGGGALRKSSLLKQINSGNFKPNLINEYFGAWNKVNGEHDPDIHARRMREAALFLKA
jgi:lysozyme